MLKRLMVVIAFLLPLLPLLAFFLLEAGLASSELAAIERLAPQSAAQLSTLLDGQEILIEGRIDLQSARSLDSLLIYIAEDRYLDADLSGQWYASQVASPFAVALPDGVVRVVNRNYVLKNPLHTIEPYSLKRYTGLVWGDRVTVSGSVTHDVSGAAPAEVAALCALLLVSLGLGLWLVRR